MIKDIVLENLLSKPLTSQISISELIGVTDFEIKEIAKSSNGVFAKDRETLPAIELISKYFGNYEIRVESYDQIVESRKTKTTTHKQKTKQNKTAEKNGDYVVAIWEDGNQFTVTFRNTEHYESHFEVYGDKIVYKLDGRVFEIVYRTKDRAEAASKKEELSEQLEKRGLSYHGEMDV